MTDLAHNHDDDLPFYYDDCPACEADQAAVEARREADRVARIEAAGGYYADEGDDVLTWVPLTQAPAQPAARAIAVTYSSIDGAHKARSFKTIAGAQAFAHRWVGANAEVAFSGYAVSADGIGKVTVEGATLAELFPPAAAAVAAARMEPEYSPAEMGIMARFGTV